VLVEVTELCVVHASTHIVCTRTFSSCGSIWAGNSTGCPTKQLAATGVCWKIRSVVPVNVWSSFRKVRQSAFLPWSLRATVSYYVPYCGYMIAWVHILSRSAFGIAVRLWHVSPLVEICVIYCHSFVVTRGRGVTQTPHPFLVPRSKNRAIPLISLRALVACKRVKPTFHCFSPMDGYQFNPATTYYVINPLKTKSKPLCLWIQSVPRCKHFSTRL
jgi:hypothetical protein